MMNLRPLLLLLLSASTASAAGLAPTALDWSGLPAAAAEAWRLGPGAPGAALTEARLDAARAEPLGPTSAYAQAMRWTGAGLDELTVAVNLPLTNAGLARRAALRAEAEALAQDAEAGAWAFEREVDELYLQWWTAARLEEHLVEWATALEASLIGARAASEAGLLSPADLADLEAEAARTRAEGAAWRAEATFAQASLERRLGLGPLLLSVEALPAPETFTPPSQNPWRAPLTGDDPGVAAALAEAEAAHARARAASPPVTLSAGVMARPGAPEPLIYGNLTLPLQNPNAAARALAKGEATAWEAEARRRDAQRLAWIQAEALAWDALVTRLNEVTRLALGPLTDRVTLLQAAFDAGQIPADRLVRARVAQHEAEHERCLIAAALVGALARAERLTVENTTVERP